MVVSPGDKMVLPAGDATAVQRVPDAACRHPEAHQRQRSSIPVSARQAACRVRPGGQNHPVRAAAGRLQAVACLEGMRDSDS